MRDTRVRVGDYPGLSIIALVQPSLEVPHTPTASGKLSVDQKGPEHVHVHVHVHEHVCVASSVLTKKDLRTCMCICVYMCMCMHIMRACIMHVHVHGACAGA